MEPHTLLIFTATVLPLICTPGPDMLFVASQAVAGGASAGSRATAGVCLGYTVHSALAALGIAAVIAASPLLFDILRWGGIAYLVYLAAKLIRSALRKSTSTLSGTAFDSPLRRGFFTALLNPKGMMIYVAILPQFIGAEGNGALQAGLLSAVFVFWCLVVYTILSLAIGAAGGRRALDDRHRRMVEGSAGSLLAVAAAAMAFR